MVRHIRLLVNGKNPHSGRRIPRCRTDRGRWSISDRAIGAVIYGHDVYMDFAWICYFAFDWDGYAYDGFVKWPLEAGESYMSEDKPYKIKKKYFDVQDSGLTVRFI